LTDLDSLVDQLDLEQIDINLFRGLSTSMGGPRVFGGQVLGQALIAALRTVEDRPCHSLHGYFLRPGDPEIPIIYEVDRIRDGKSFATRRIVAIQKGEAIFSMAASFHVSEPGLSHQCEMPNVPPPEDCYSEDDLLSENLADNPELQARMAAMRMNRPIEMRRVEPISFVNPVAGEPIQHTGFNVFWPTLQIWACCPLAPCLTDNHFLLGYKVLASIMQCGFIVISELMSGYCLRWIVLSLVHLGALIGAKCSQQMER
jgi:acyl-CoA thioesterase II